MSSNPPGTAASCRCPECGWLDISSLPDGRDICAHCHATFPCPKELRSPARLSADYRLFAKRRVQ